MSSLICMCANAICGSLCLAAETMKWNQGRLLRSSCLCIHTWCGKRFFGLVFAPVPCVWLQAGKETSSCEWSYRIQSQAHKWGHQGLQTIFEHFLTDNINIKLLDVLAFFPCLWNIGLFSGVAKAKIWQRSCHTDYDKLVVSSSLKADT